MSGSILSPSFIYNVSFTFPSLSVKGDLNAATLCRIKTSDLKYSAAHRFVCVRIFVGFFVVFFHVNTYR